MHCVSFLAYEQNNTILVKILNNSLLSYLIIE